MRKLVGALCLLVVAAGCGTPAISGVPRPVPTFADQATTPPEPVEVGPPQHVSIPAIDAASDLVPTGINEDGTLEVPPVSQPQQASWYTGFSEPGEAGRPAVILGHVNGGGQPGVFVDLHLVEVGDEVLVDDLVFEVTKTVQVDKDSFPTEEVYGKTSHPTLRLITCGGVFNYGADSYEDNIIVYAALVQE